MRELFRRSRRPRGMVKLSIPVACAAIALLGACGSSDSSAEPEVSASASSTEGLDSAGSVDTGTSDTEPADTDPPASTSDSTEANGLGADEATARSSSPDDLEEDHRTAVVAVDFVGQLVAADTPDWVVLEDGGPPTIIATTPGGPTSEHEVGPGTLTLADGSVVDVKAGTPGGSYCSLLSGPQMPGSSCLIVGQFQPGTTTAAWFATELGETIGDYDHVVSVVPTEGLNAAIPAGDVLAGVSINPNAEMVDCGPGNLRSDPVELPDAAAYYGALGSDGSIVALFCAYDY